MAIQVTDCGHVYFVTVHRIMAIGRDGDWKMGGTSSGAGLAEGHSPSPAACGSSLRLRSVNILHCADKSVVRCGVTFEELPVRGFDAVTADAVLHREPVVRAVE